MANDIPNITQLIKQLAAITENGNDALENLPKMLSLLQPWLPFELAVSCPRPLSEGQFGDTGLLRIAVDEYQLIGEKQLLEMTKLKKETLAEAAGNDSLNNSAGIYASLANEKEKLISALQKIWIDFFGLKSCLVFPLALTGGCSVTYFFYSRKENTYSNAHLELLQGLSKYLLEVSYGLIGEQLQPVQDLASQPSCKFSSTARHPGFDQVIGGHPLLMAALDLASKVARYSTSVLILGESGTGKERIARSIHSLSTKKSGPYIKVNCAAIPAALIESELFGHEKGAFTGATEKRKGKFEQAHGGTIFLDEIGELPLEMQVKLLRVLQEKEIEYVGGNSPRSIDVRIIAATNRDLEAEVAQGNFRLDLYYRLNVFPITLPALRERKSDISALSLFFADKFCTEFGKPFPGIAQSMIQQMLCYDWPGNIRELENVLEQSVVLSEGDGELQLRRNLNVKSNVLADKISIETMEDVKHAQRETERDYIVSVLQKTNGRIRGADGAAQLLNIKPTTLESRMAKLEIKREDFINFLRNLSGFPTVQPSS